MGPLIPQEIIDPGWSNVIALLIGLGFGFVLESAGFSSSRKLAGIFYLYDFTVLRVFMTAVVTAMVGLMYFNYLGWIDYSLIYTNPLYIRSAIVGGVIMGFGFILGGYCPGTSVCAVGIGKIDAMVFTGGMFLGILAFSEAYPLLEHLYNQEPLGPVKIYDSLGMSPGLFAFLLIALSVAAFFVGSYILGKVKKVEY
ncbi:MAG TPA: YeeE/YedE thiosulfate transporter family protein [Bacteroidales bacterium]|nr:YeeE/YedE thiosulfate transporter family protein [Bacteroidales bacterium]HRZ76387.1 YeeE/YedE thiosulfate transporter family protein [Bacteroidales bacterium]